MTWKQKWHRSRRAHAKNNGRYAMRLAEAKRLYREGQESGQFLFWPYLRGPIEIEHRKRFEEIAAKYPLLA